MIVRERRSGFGLLGRGLAPVFWIGDHVTLPRNAAAAAMYFDLNDVLRNFDSGTYGRGQAYARSGKVRMLVVSDDATRIDSKVSGSADICIGSPSMAASMVMCSTSRCAWPPPKRYASAGRLASRVRASVSLPWPKANRRLSTELFPHQRRGDENSIRRGRSTQRQHAAATSRSTNRSLNGRRLISRVCAPGAGFYIKWGEFAPNRPT